MKHAAISVLVFGFYLAGQGAILLLAPNLLLGILGLPPTDEAWIRAVGVALLVLSYYYMRTSLANNLAFFRWSVHGRSIQLLLIGGLVLSGSAPAILGAFALFEFLSGVWTWLALRSAAES